MASRIFFASSFLAVLLACAAPGCGDSQGSEGGAAGDHVSAGGSSGNGGTAGSSGSSGSAGTAGASGAGTSGSAGASGSAGTGGSAGSAGSSAGGAGGAGGNPTTGSGGAAGGPQTGSVGCDNLTCSVPATSCCQHYNQPAECLMPGASCTYGVPLSCDGPEDCASGQVCCATIDTQGPANAYVSVACAATCTGKNYRVVCGASGMCPSGKTCAVSDLLPPYLDCK